MKNIIIYAHPPTKGYCKDIFEEIKSCLSSYQVLDLYSMNFDPILKKEEHYTSGNKKISESTKAIQKKIERADNLFFIYPVWWASMPAILKGFFDRVFTPKYAFEFLKGGIPNGLLKGKKARVFITSGAPCFVYMFSRSNPSVLIKKPILEFCGIKTKVFHFGNLSKYLPEKSQKVRRKVRNILKDF